MNIEEDLSIVFQTIPILNSFNFFLIVILTFGTQYNCQERQILNYHKNN